jgi:hypothetical protein
LVGVNNGNCELVQSDCVGLSDPRGAPGSMSYSAALSDSSVRAQNIHIQ